MRSTRIAIVLIALSVGVVSCGAVGAALYAGLRAGARSTRATPVPSGEPRLVVQRGHSGSIRDAVYSPDGSLVVSGGGPDRVAILWDAATGRELRRLAGHSNQINAVAFSPDGRLVATASGGGSLGEWEAEVEDFTARLWDVSTGREARRFEGHTGVVNAVAFSPDGRTLVTASDDRTVRLWDLQTGRLARQVQQAAPVYSVAYSPDGRYVLAGGGAGGGWFDDTCENCEATLWETGAWRPVRTLGAGSRPVGSVSFSTDGRFALVAALSPETDRDVADADLGESPQLVSQWEVATGRKVREVPGFGPARFSPDSTFFVVAGASSDGAGAQVFDALTGRSRYHVEENRDTGNFVGGVVRTLAVSPSGSDILVGFDSLQSSGNYLAEFGRKGLYVVAADSGRRRLALEGDTAKHTVTELVTGGLNPVREAGRFVQVGGDVWDTTTGARTSLEGVGEGVELSPPQVLSADGRLLLSHLFDPGADGTRPVRTEFCLWDTETGALVRRLDAVPYGVTSFIETGAYAAWITPDSRYVLFETVVDDEHPLGEGFVLSLYDIATGRKRWHQLLEPQVYGANSRYLSQRSAMSAVSPDGRFVYATASTEAIAADAPVEEGAADPLGEQPAPLTGQVLLTLETETGRILERTPRFDGEPARGVQISPDGRYLVLDGALYDLGARRFLLSDLGENGTFSGDGRRYVAQSADGRDGASTLRIYDVEAGKAVRTVPASLRLGDTVLFSPDGSKLLISYRGNADTSDSVHLVDASTGSVLFTYSHDDVVTSSAFTGDGRHVITSSEDGSSGIWSAATGEEVCRLYSFRNGDWAVTTPDGRFDTNDLDEVEGLHWVVSSEPLRPLPVEIFMRQYYEPRLLARVLAGEPLRPLPSLAALNRAQPRVRVVDVKPDSADTVEVTVAAEEVASEAQKDASGNAVRSGVFDVRLFRDGQLVGYAPERPPGDAGGSVWEWIASVVDAPPEVDGEVELDGAGAALLRFPGVRLPRTGVERVEFSAYAFNADRVKSETDRTPYEIRPALPRVKGRAYVVSIGANAYENGGLNLRYAANDARRVQEGVAARLAAGGQYSEVIGIPLVSDYEVALGSGRTAASHEATLRQARGGAARVTEDRAKKAHLRAVLDALAGREAGALAEVPNGERLRTARPEDLLLLTISSHGYTDGDGVFYMVPSDCGTSAVSSAEFRERCVSSDELSEWLRDVDAGEVVLIVDACHSAAAVEGTEFKPGPMGSRGLGQLSYDKGMRILTSTQADDVALEANAVRQGLLVYSLVEDGLERWGADYRPRDRAVMLGEWLSYGAERVPRLYEEVRDGRGPAAGAGRGGSAPRVVRETVDTAETAAAAAIASERTQQPSLFDFARRRKETLLAATATRDEQQAHAR